MAKDPDPTTLSHAYQVMAPRIHKVATLLGGTEAMRDAGKVYLPAHTSETDSAWQERLASATLFNMTDLTLNSWVGRPFSDPVRLIDVPKEIDAVAGNIDRQGNSLAVVARDWFRDALAKGLSHVLVDMPRIASREPRTLADDREEKNAPYWTRIRPEQVLGAVSVIIDGEEVLTHLRILETSLVMDPDTFEEKEILRVREMNALPDDPFVEVRMWAQQKDPRTKKVVWRIDDVFQMDIPFIPLVTFYTNREDFMVAKSPLLDLANVNIRHWQSQSDQNIILTVTRFPMLAASGLVGADEIESAEVGPRKVLVTSDPSGKFYYVEHSGKAISAGRDDLDDLASQMSNYGAEFLKRKPGSPSATARALDTSESTSPLQDLAMRFQDTIATALGMMARWLDIPAGGSVEINTEFGPEVFEQFSLDALTKMRERGDISRDAYIEEMKRRDIVSDTYDADADKAKIEAEQMAGFNDRARMDEDEEVGDSAGDDDSSDGGAEDN